MEEIRYRAELTKINLNQYMDLNEDRINLYFTERKQRLIDIQPVLSKKLVQMIADKIFLEEKLSRELILEQDTKQTALQKYSFVLSQNYFEQEFLKK